MNDFWWKAIPNAAMFIDDIAKKVLSDESVVYTINNTFPWKEQFINNLRQSIEGAFKELLIIHGDDCMDKNPGDYLINRFCKDELRSKYRASVGTEKFLAVVADKTILIDRFILLRDCNQTQAQQWSDFITRYDAVRDKKAASCCFILECQSGYSITTSLNNIIWEKYYHQYDINMYCLMIASDLKLSSILKSYISELSVILCEKDVEFAAKLTERGVDMIGNPEKTVEGIVNECRRSDNRNYPMPNNISNKIWEAQVKLFFPIIEKYRTRFIEEHINLFPINFKYDSAFGDSITDVHDLELGMIKNLCSQGVLYINSQEYKELGFFRMCRNKLAHISCLELEDIQRIIDVKKSKNDKIDHRVPSYV